MNVTLELPNALISVLDGTRLVASAHASLPPRTTFRKTFSELLASAIYTVELRNEAGEILLRHTKGKYKRGLTRFADCICIGLNRAAGRLEVILRQYGAAVPHLLRALAWVQRP